MPLKDPAKRREYAKHYARAWKSSDPAHRVRAREISKKGSQTFRAKRKELLERLKSAPCMDCGRTFPPCCMDFDHRVGEIKVGNVGRLAHAAVLEVLLEEIAKCDLVCSNCHRIRTHVARPVEH